MPHSSVYHRFSTVNKPWPPSVRQKWCHCLRQALSCQQLETNHLLFLESAVQGTAKPCTLQMVGLNERQRDMKSWVFAHMKLKSTVGSQGMAWFGELSPWMKPKNLHDPSYFNQKIVRFERHPLTKHMFNGFQRNILYLNLKKRSKQFEIKKTDIRL